ncbi:RIC1-domain-containing protein [Cladochytrium replicatum]|nr:RIC1-domain-containing protein [Cladochytrium replicatum]
MFFATGTAKVLSSKNDELDGYVNDHPSLGEAVRPDILDIQKSYDASLFAAITYSTVYLWSCRPEVMISKVVRSETTVREDGENRAIIWKTDSTMLAVITDKGFLHFYDVVTLESRVFDFQFSYPHHYIMGPGEGNGVLNKALRFKMALEIDTGIEGGIGLPDQLLLCTRDSPSILSLSWSGEVNVQGTMSLADIPFLHDPNDPICKMVTTRYMDLYGWVTVNGRAYITQRRKMIPEIDSNGDVPVAYTWSGLCFYQPSDPNLVLSSVSAKPSEAAPNQNDGDADGKEEPAGVEEEKEEGEPSEEGEEKKDGESGEKVPEEAKANGKPSTPPPTPQQQQPELPTSPQRVHPTTLITGNGQYATSMTINSKLLLVAVGLSDGDVLIFHISDDRTRLSYSHKLSLLNPLNTQFTPKLGIVNTMEWSYDGYGLAVGWSLGGVSVWSAFGRLLMSTVSEDTFVQTPDGVSDQLPEAYFHGVRELFWGPGSYELFMLPHFGTEGAPTEIYVISFAKSAISLFNTMDNVRNVFLVCDDRILLYEGNNKEFDVMNLDLVQWDTLQIPVMYITQNWPIRYATVSPSGNFLAIAGKRGLAHYSTESKRWKLFGNEQQEQSFVVRGGMLWHRNILIVACQDVMTSDHELRFLSRDANLDSSAALHIEQMPSLTIAMDCLDQNVLVYSGDNVMRYYRIVPVQGGTRLRLHLHLQVSLQGVVHHPLYVQSIAWYPPPVSSELTVEDMKKAPVIILKNGELSLLRELSDEGWEHVILMDKIEYFWISRYGERCGDLFNSLWAFDGVGAKVWTNLILNPDTLTRWRPEETYVESLRIDLDCTPLTIMFHRGIIMGIEQRMSLRNPVNCAVFKHETKTHLFLHHMIRNLLMKKLQQEAVEFANCFGHLEYFGHALEVMLHKVLDDEVDTLSSSNVLPQIVKFLENFPSYLDVIVQCARKTEVSQWKYFFSIVGEVKDLFHQCLELGALTTATSYLIVIQTLEPPDVSGKLAVKLLDRAFEIEDFETGRELVRFLASIEGDERVPFDEGAIAVLEEKEKFDRADAIRFHDDTNQDLWYVGILIGKSARRLLEKRRIRSLGRFAGTMSFNLSDFLKREK